MDSNQHAPTNFVESQRLRRVTNYFVQARRAAEMHAEQIELGRDCPACGSTLGEESILGDLGGVTWFRCRFCGWDFK